MHTSTWPTAEECGEGGDAEVLTAVAEALAGVRGAKSQAKVSQRTDATRAVVTGPAEQVARVRAGEADLRAAGRIGALELVEGGEGLVVSEVELAEPQG